MADSVAWKALADGGDSDAVVLAVDFDTTGRPEARFADLVSNLKSDLAVWETVPPAVAPGASLAASDYLDHWVAAVEPDRVQVRALLGFCAGSVYAAALAERIAAWQRRPPLLLLFDPELSTSQTLMWQFHKVIGFLDSVLTADQIAQARATGQQLHEQITELGPLKDALIRVMREAGEPALIAAGLDEPRRAELFGVFNSFLSYLAAAGEIDPLERWRTATAFSSTTPLSGLNAMRRYASLTGTPEIPVGREVTIEVDHGTMLANEELAAAVSDLLNG